MGNEPIICVKPPREIKFPTLKDCTVEVMALVWCKRATTIVPGFNECSK